MTREKHIQYWLDSAHHDLDAAESLFADGKYDRCLFLAHLVLEKTLKSHFVMQNDKVPPKTHNLVKLSELSHLELTEGQRLFSDQVMI